MKSGNFTTSSCRHCRYYQAEGRRGGQCHQLSVPVRSEWAACTLAARPFNAAWESLEEVVRLEHSLSLDYEGDSEKAEIPVEILAEEQAPLRSF